MPRGRRNYNSAQSDLESNARSARSFSFRIPEVQVAKIEAIQSFIIRKRKRAYKELMQAERAASEAAAEAAENMKRFKSDSNDDEHEVGDTKRSKNNKGEGKVETSDESMKGANKELPLSAPVSDSTAISADAKSDESGLLEQKRASGSVSIGKADGITVPENKATKDGVEAIGKVIEGSKSDGANHPDEHTDIEPDLVKSISEEEAKAKQMCEDKTTSLKIVQDDVVGLNKTKSQMIWLLKQVITLEAKRKMAAAKKKKK